jgi:aldehyde dehydrogenase (NAD+)
VTEEKDDDASLVGVLVAELRRAIEAMYGATPAEQRTCQHYPRLINVGAAQRAEALIEANRGHVVYGGETDPDHCYVAPTIIVNPDPESEILREEVFSPVLPIVVVRTLDGAVRLANTKSRPLALYVFSSRRAFQDRVLRDISSGGAVVNDTMVHFSNSRLPFGGVGTSGLGQYHGKWTFRTFVHDRAVVRATFFTRFAMFLRVPPFNWVHNYITIPILNTLS